MSLTPAPAPGQRPAGRRRAAAGSVTFVAAAIFAGALAGCTPSTNYVGSAQHGLYFEVPNTWRTFTSVTLKRLQLVNEQEFQTAAAEEQTYPVYISLSSPVSGGRFSNLAGAYPWALAEVHALGVADQQTLSLDGLEDQLFPVDEEVGNESELFPARLISEGALRGTVIGYQIDTPTGSLAFEQAAVMNSATTKAWVLSVGCAPACFRANRHIFDHIVSTFTVTGQKG
ncbi:MAG TPA: hypothetical protein VME46_01250 [Acidimicrobiales bacterium]|nr:hypothetical protein [Acidimicrobiales bacterium]